jgi:hypothetical protein
MYDIITIDTIIGNNKNIIMGAGNEKVGNY